MLRASLLTVLLSLSPFVFAEEPSTAPAAPETVKVARGSVVAMLTEDGYFEPLTSVEVHVRPQAYSGELKIASIAANGASVKAGDPLLEVDATDLKREIATAEAEAATAQAVLIKAKTDLDLESQSDALMLHNAEKELSDAQFELKWFDEVAGKQFLQNVDLELKSIQDSVEDQQDELDQLKKMYKSEELTSATADIVVKRAVRQLERMKIALEMTTKSVEKQKTQDFAVNRRRIESAVEARRLELEKLKASQAQGNTTRKAAIVTAENASQKATEKLDKLKKDLERFNVKAESAGQVLYGSVKNGVWRENDPKTLKPGEKISADQVVLTLYTPGALRVVAAVSEERLGMIKAGLPARVVPLSYPDAGITGVTEAPSANATSRDTGPKYLTNINANPIDPRIGPGYRAQVRIDAGRADNVLILPAEAVANGAVRKLVSGGKVVWTDVVTGLSDGKTIEIKQGLNEGDAVLKTANP